MTVEQLMARLAEFPPGARVDVFAIENYDDEVYVPIEPKMLSLADDGVVVLNPNDGDWWRTDGPRSHVTQGDHS